MSGKTPNIAVYNAKLTSTMLTAAKAIFGNPSS
jgi:hypothetical protein